MPGRIVVTQYVSLDGVIEDPVGMESSGLGNWTGPFARGPEGDRSSTRSFPRRSHSSCFPTTSAASCSLRSAVNSVAESFCCAT